MHLALFVIILYKSIFNRVFAQFHCKWFGRGGGCGWGGRFGDIPVCSAVGMHYCVYAWRNKADVENVIGTIDRLHQVQRYINAFSCYQRIILKRFFSYNTQAHNAYRKVRETMEKG